MTNVLVLAALFAGIIIPGTLAALIHDRLTGHRGPGTFAPPTPRQIPRIRPQPKGTDHG